MQNSQLAEVLRSLDKNEFREFGKFVRSPYFNNRSEVVRFYDAFKKYYPEFNSKDFSTEKMFSKIYSGKKYNDVLMRKVISLMINLLMDFFANTNFKEEIFDYNIRIMSRLRNKKLMDLYEKKIKYMDKLFKNSKHTFGYYEHKFKFTYSLSSFFHIKDEKAMAQNLQKEIDDFIEYFLTIMPLLYFRSTTLSRLYNIKYDLKFFDEVTKYFSENDLKDVTICWLYYNMAMLTSTVEEKYYFELVSSKDRFEDRLSEIDKYNVYVSLYTYCINKIKTGDFSYRRLLMENTKTLMKNNIFPEGFGYLPPYTFTGNVINAASLKDFSWASNFIKNNKGRLDPKLQNELVHYAESVLEFEKGNYEKSLAHLSTINLERGIMKLHCKNLLIMNYYELSYHEELLSLIDTYKHFIKRDKSISEEFKKIITLFIKYLSPLLKVKLNGNRSDVLRLKDQLDMVEFFPTKDWLMEKVKELIKK